MFDTFSEHNSIILLGSSRIILGIVLTECAFSFSITATGSTRRNYKVYNNTCYRDNLYQLRLARRGDQPERSVWQCRVDSDIF